MTKKKNPTEKKQSDNQKMVLMSDTESHNAVISALKRTFSRSPIVQNFLKKNRREEIWFKKDGTQAKKPRVFYKCAKCGCEFNSNSVQVDHIEPVIPLNIPSKHLPYDTIIKRLFCDESNLQILCKEHHKEKSHLENEIRKEWITKIKYIVYETTNRVNHKKYIGVHKCEDYDDYYLGSGTALKAAILKYGKEQFYRCILYVFDNAEDAYAKEKELVIPELIESQLYYNIKTGGQGNIPEIVNNDHLKKKIICHQTEEIFESITAVAKSLDVSVSSISKAINNPDQPVKNLHFFTLDQYDPSMPLFFPKIGKNLICLNNKIKYSSIQTAANELSLNYKSLRNALITKTSDGFYALDGYYFLYDYEYDADKTYEVTVKQIKCVELNKIFNTCVEAAIFLKHNNPNSGGIAIAKAIRENTKMYKYTWTCEYSKQPI